MWQIWLIICGFSLVAEIITTGFLVFWFAIGALFAMIVSFFTDNIIIQTAVFVISSLLLIIFTKPLVRKFIGSKDTIPTNAYSIIGKEGIVTQEIDSSKGLGQIKVGTEIWSAKNEQDQIIPKDAKIEITAIDGVKAVVSIKELTSKK